MNSRYGYRSVFFLRGVGNEVVLCVSTLMLTARGLSLSEIAWMLTLGFAATTLLEVPSGIIGDLWGRKRLWILSVLCSLGWLIACLSGIRMLIVFGAVLNGVGVALGPRRNVEYVIYLFGLCRRGGHQRCLAPRLGLCC